MTETTFKKAFAFRHRECNYTIREREYYAKTADVRGVAMNRFYMRSEFRIYILFTRMYQPRARFRIRATTRHFREKYFLFALTNKR